MNVEILYRNENSVKLARAKLRFDSAAFSDDEEPGVASFLVCSATSVDPLQLPVGRAGDPLRVLRNAKIRAIASSKD